MHARGLDILVVDDHAPQREIIRDFLLDENHRVSEAANGEQALRQLKCTFFDLILLDLKMPGMNGLEVLKEAKKINPETDAVIVTAYGTIETAVEAMRAGARDFITKPIDIDELSALVAKIADCRKPAEENETLPGHPQRRCIATDIIKYKSQKMADLIGLVAAIAPSHATALIQGETGTGKELLARLVHRASSRADGPFITVNCAAIPETLIESELFGHEKGAFTGAARRRTGVFEEANGGTLFLDEIGELSPRIQVKLLRFLQEREFRRVGGNRMLRSDVRIVSATHRDLETSVKEGDLREDLFYRLNVVKILVPPLRERREDIPVLTDYFIARFARENRKTITGITREARDLLMRYDYPGNVRELENIVERAVIVSRGSMITAGDLLLKGDQCSAVAGSCPPGGTLPRAMAALERQMILEALEKAASNQTRAANLLGLSERMLRYKLKKHGIQAQGLQILPEGRSPAEDKPLRS